MPKNSSVKEVTNKAKQTAKRAATNPWFERLARFGYTAKGVVHITIGVLATQVALGIGGKVTGSEGALKTIVMQPFGSVLLLIIAVGLVGYVVWCLVQAILDPEYQDSTPQRVFPRLGYALSGLSYSGLAVAAAKLIAGFDDSDNSNSSSVSWTAALLSQPFGRCLVVLIGVTIIFVGFSFFYQAYTAEFCEQFNVIEMSNIELFWARHVGRLGMSARGSVNGVIDIFLIQSALRYNPQEAKGLRGALIAIAQQPYGLFLLGVIAMGLIAYGIHELVLARYRRIILM